ncbi:eukaryotic translation initiation factor 3 subunit F-like [Molothrus ater]|uniref:eukaryotic translation initiation factor 3 subunit F-like n=1 Tax=Molothrus ater TaxID=84834 RepID=UPI0023E7F54D|nr:eukaryotic translation initiation factor 3 subunit F-like [Molothrus ater]
MIAPPIVPPTIPPLSPPTACHCAPPPAPASGDGPSSSGRPVSRHAPSSPSSGSHAPPSGSHGSGPGGGGAKGREPEPAMVPSAAPVVYQPEAGGGVRRQWVPLSHSQIKELVKAQKEYGRESEYFRGVLEATLSEAEITPFDVRRLFTCLLNPSERLISRLHGPDDHHYPPDSPPYRDSTTTCEPLDSSPAKGERVEDPRSSHGAGAHLPGPWLC